MEMLSYEKPQLKFVSLYNREVIADKCWGLHGDTGKFEWYMDKEGLGFYRFSVATADSCALISTDVVYMEGKNDPDPTPILPNTPEYEKFLAGLKEAAGGNTGNPFNGNGGISDGDHIPPSWSWT